MSGKLFLTITISFTLLFLQAATCLAAESINFTDNYDDLNFIDQASLDNMRLEAGYIIPFGKSSQIADDDLVALLHFEELNNNTAKNAVGLVQDDNGSVSDNISLTNEGRYGNAFYFYGAAISGGVLGGGYMSLSTVLFPSKTIRGYSYAVWFKPEVLGGAIFSTGAYYRRPVVLSITANKLSFRTSSTSQSATISGTTVLSSNQWYHVAAVYDPLGNETRLYLNGQIEARRQGLVALGLTDLGDLTIGKDSDHYNPFKGIIDELYVFTRPLSDDDVLSIFNNDFVSGSFESKEIGLEGTFNTLKVEVNESNAGVSQIYVWASDDWHRVYNNEETVFDMPARMPISKLKYKVVFAGNTSLNSINFTFSDKEYWKDDNKFSFMYIADDNSGDRGNNLINFSYTAYPDLAFIASVPDDGSWIPRKSFYKRYAGAWLGNPNALTDIIPIFFGSGNHDAESPITIDLMSKRIGPKFSAFLPGMRNFKEGPYDVYPLHDNYEDRYLQYSFDYKNCHFIMMNDFFHDHLACATDACDRFGPNYTPVGCISQDLLNWLEEDLENNPATFKFIFHHYHFYVDPGDPRSPYGNNAYCDVNNVNKFIELLNKYKVTAMFVGHSDNPYIYKVGDTYEYHPGLIHGGMNGGIVSIEGNTATIRRYYSPGAPNPINFTLMGEPLVITTSTFYGDVSGDEEISAYDAALTAQAAVGLITLTAEQTQNADVSGDAEVSAYDAALIAQRAVGLIDKFPVEG